MRTVHREVFHHWLSLSLVQQRGDLTRYLGHQTSEDDALVRRLRDTHALDALPPEDAAKHERDLFVLTLPAVFHSVLADLES
jgi:hypothetical protein